MYRLLLFFRVPPTVTGVAVGYKNWFGRTVLGCPEDKLVNPAASAELRVGSYAEASIFRGLLTHEEWRSIVSW